MKNALCITDKTVTDNRMISFMLKSLAKNTGILAVIGDFNAVYSAVKSAGLDKTCTVAEAEGDFRAFMDPCDYVVIFGRLNKPLPHPAQDCVDVCKAWKVPYVKVIY